MNKTERDQITFTDPATGEKVSAAAPKVAKVEDQPVSKGTGMTAAKPEQLTALAAKFAK